MVIAASSDRDLFLNSLIKEVSITTDKEGDRREARWKKPCYNWLKANWDAFVCTKQNKTGLGIIIRNDQGAIMARVSANVKPCVKPMVAEGITLRRAMEVCANLGFVRVVFEGDSQIIVKAANCDEDLSSNYGTWVHDARVILLEKPGWQVAFFYREANRVAHQPHQLAKVALVHDDEQIWIKDGSMQIIMSTIYLEHSM